MERYRGYGWAHAVSRLFFLAVPLVAYSDQKGPSVLLTKDSNTRARWAKEWLTSGTPREVAWGAWLVRVDRQATMVPLLLRKIAVYQPSEKWQGHGDQHDAMLQVLDTLIAMRVAMRPEEAGKLYVEFPAQSLILLIRSQQVATSTFLKLFASANANWNWLAAGNVLLNERAQGFSDLLLQKLTQRVDVFVVKAGFGSGSGGGGSECGFSLGAPKSDWPPVGLYRLTQFPERIPWLDTQFLIGGETPVYYWRTERGNYDNPPDAAGYCDQGDRDKYRAQYLNKLLEGSFPTARFAAYVRIDIEWHDNATYRKALSAAIDEKLANFRYAVVALRASRLLKDSEILAYKPRIEIVVHDERHINGEPLAKVGDYTEVDIRSTFSKPLP